MDRIKVLKDHKTVGYCFCLQPLTPLAEKTFYISK